MSRPDRLTVVVTFSVLLLLAVVPVGTVRAQTDDVVEVSLLWAGCTRADSTGAPLAMAVRYEVMAVRDGEAETKLAEVRGDTTCTVELARGSVYRLRVVGYDRTDRPSEPSEWSDPLYYEPQQQRGAGETPEIPTLAPNAPNPFNPATRIRYGIPQDLPETEILALEIYDVRGVRLRAFAVERTAGWHEVLWDGTDQRGDPQPTGLYVSRFVCGDRVETRKMMLVK